MNDTPRLTTRFAPSPTGYLHLGHAYAALFAHQSAHQSDGRFLLRLEDIDLGRCRPEFEDAIYEDLTWLGLKWEHPVRRQSDCMADYQGALARLDEQGVLYPCFCTRKDIQAEIDAAGGAPHGPDGLIYPGTCRQLASAQRQERIQSGEAHALRLNMDQALKPFKQLSWKDLDKGAIIAEPQMFGDVVLARKDTPTSYHLAVTLDDHIQGVTCVTRGEDLFAATHVHRLLQALLNLNTPVYRHHGLLTATDGRRLAKRDKAQTIRSLRGTGHSPADVRTMAGYPQKNYGDLES